MRRANPPTKLPFMLVSGVRSGWSVQLLHRSFTTAARLSKQRIRAGNRSEVGIEHCVETSAEMHGEVPCRSGSVGVVLGC